MAMALNGGHVARARDFFHTAGKYFIIGGTAPWVDENGEVNDSEPAKVSENEFRLRDVVGLKKVDNTHFVVKVPDGEGKSGDIEYRNQTWRIVKEEVLTSTTTAVSKGSNKIIVNSAENLLVGSKVRVNNLYEGIITDRTDNELTLNIEAPEDIPAGSVVLGGAEVEGAKYIYVDCYLNYNEFPVVQYRQLGLCSGVKARTSASITSDDILLSAGVEGRTQNDYETLGVLEILDNRVPSTRDIDQREQLSLIIEF